MPRAIYSPRRGTKAMNDLVVLPDFTGVAVHDGWSPYHQCTSARHGSCNAHHIRELIAVTGTATPPKAGPAT